MYPAFDFLIQPEATYFFLLLHSNFIIFSFILKYMTHFELVFVQSMRSMSRLLCVCWFQFFSSICWKVILSLLICFTLCQRLVHCSIVSVWNIPQRCTCQRLVPQLETIGKYWKLGGLEDLSAIGNTHLKGIMGPWALPPYFLFMRSGFAPPHIPATCHHRASMRTTSHDWNLQNSQIKPFFSINWLSRVFVTITKLTVSLLRSQACIATFSCPL